MIETLIPAALTLGGAILGGSWIVAGVRDPSHRPAELAPEQILDRADRPEMPRTSR